MKVVVDNEDATFVGDWTRSELFGAYNITITWQPAGTGTNTVTFTPDLPQAGNYDVFAWWVAGANRVT
jgi:hypothetical protein